MTNVVKKVDAPVAAGRFGKLPVNQNDKWREGNFTLVAMSRGLAINGTASAGQVPLYWSFKWQKSHTKVEI